MTKRAVIFLAEGFEETEAVTTIDVLRRAGIDVVVAGVESKIIKASRGVVVASDVLLSEVEGVFDAYILPGGMPGAMNLAKNDSICEILLGAYKSGKIIAAICASPPIVLEPLGILKGRSATCYPGMETEFNAETHFVADDVVIDGNIITSRGPATAMAFASAIVQLIMGKDVADKIRQGLLMP